MKHQTVSRRRATSNVAIFRMPIGGRIAVWLLAAFAWAEIAAANPDSLAVMLTQAPLAAGVGMGFCFACLSSRMTVAGSGVRVQNFFIERNIPWDQLTSVRSDNGLTLHLHTRRTVGVTALGGSIISQLVQNRRQRQAAEAIESRRPPGSSGAAVDGGAGAAQLSARAVRITVIVFVVYYATGIIAFAATR